MRLIQVGVPVITVVGFVLVSSFSQNGRSRWMAIPMVLSVMASVIFSLYSFRSERRRAARTEREYANRLVELNKDLHIAHDLQRRFYSYNYADVAALFSIAQQAHSRRSPHSEGARTVARLWERRTGDADFGVVRLGIGARPSTVIYNLGSPGKDDNAQSRAALKLAADSRFVDNIPVTLMLRGSSEDAETLGTRDKDQLGREVFVHALGVAGVPSLVYAFTRAVLAHFVVFHAFTDTRLYVLASESRAWKWTEHLPHCRDDAQGRSRCFVNEVKPPDDDLQIDDEGNEVEQFLEDIRKMLAQRKIRMGERESNEARGNPTLPFMLVVIDLLDIEHFPNSRLHKLESDAAMAFLLEEGARLGAAVIFLVPERAKIPSGCHGVIEIAETAPATNSNKEEVKRLHFRFACTGVNSTRYVGEADSIGNLRDAASIDEMSALARMLEPLTLRQGDGAGLADAVPFLKLMGYQDMGQLRDDARRRWQASTEPRRADWLRVRIGRMAGNKPRALVFSARRDGVHGMVAGSTGSGKSELLISLIVGMAVTYNPSALNFVLVDYKGGGAFKDLEPLPHCVDIITNLAADGVTRMFTAIQAELKRRQKLNTDTSTKNIVEYRQKGLHITGEPYPFLFIIIDEFAEMIADRPEFKGELESITRVGRSSGVSLILAAQRPSGVTDQMRANIKFRICLRVETGTESREMLRRTDAAFLPTGIPGRGYLQVGNEEIELIQVAYSGGEYADPTKQEAPVIWPGRRGASNSAQDQGPLELYKVIVAAMKTLADDVQSAPQRAPWPKPLPRLLALSETLITAAPTGPDEPKVALVPTIAAVTAKKYLRREEQITLGHQWTETLTLNPAMNRWINNHCGWHDRLNWEKYAMRPVIGLVDNPYVAEQWPLVVDLPRGHVAVFGASGSGKTTFLRTLIASLAATHSPSHFHAYILDLGGRNLTLFKEMPHVGAVVLPDEEGYQERVQQILSELDTLIDERKTKLDQARASTIYQYNKANPNDVLPAVVVVIDNFVEFAETFGVEKDNVESVLTRTTMLLRQSRAYGIHFVVSTGRLDDLSGQLYSLFTERFALRLIDPVDYRAIVGASVPGIGDVPGRGYTSIDREALAFQVAVAIDMPADSGWQQAAEIKELERIIAAMVKHVADSPGTYKLPVKVETLPRAVLLKKLLAERRGLALDASFTTALTEKTREQWALSTQPKPHDWLKVVIGVTAGNKPRTLEFEASRDGVHGMVAGGTGSGKSELLMTLIVSLALSYDPSMLNFVLVDYKGGGAFKPFEELPHCVGTLTNLNSSAVRRMFTAIGAEMRRRQQLNTDTKTANIIEYREKGLHTRHKPYPHLLIIIDEYAEMISSSPEFGAELDSITRLGRAQGVYLLLAAQRPTGVSDQMRANIKYRICLRVEGADTSREMLRRSDAAFLPNGMPGRGYLQIGNENIELMQVAYAGESYEFVQLSEGGERPKFFEFAVQLALKLMTQDPPRAPWPPPLESTLTFDHALSPSYVPDKAKHLVTFGQAQRLEINPFVKDWLGTHGAWPGVDWATTAMRAVVGLVDDPYQGQQLPLEVDFTRGHAVLFGAAGWGKTTFVRSLVLSLAATHSPNEFHAHVLDLGGRSLKTLEDLPHVGTVITPDERGYEERIQQLLRRLSDEVEERKQNFGVMTLYQYNNQPGVKPLPAILIVIDNIVEYIETFQSAAQQDDPSNLFNVLVGLLRQGKAYGLHFIATANRVNALTGKLYSLFSERYAVRLSDASDYGAVVGAQVPELDEIGGRGYTRVDRMALSFQVAIMPQVLDVEGRPINEAALIAAMGKRMRSHMVDAGCSYTVPLRIDALLERFPYRDVLAKSGAVAPDASSLVEGLKRSMQTQWARNASAEHANWLKVALGLTSGNELRTLALEAKADGVHGMVAGGTGSGKSELLMALIVGLAVNYPPDILNFVLVDYKGGGAFKPFQGLPHCVDIVTNLNKAAVERMFTAINSEIRRRQELNARTDTKDIIDYRKRGLHLKGEPYPHLFVIIDEYAEMIQENDAYLQALESITRVGRAQGVNLLLASQQPKRVTDQMRANIKLRLCLRVEQIDTSRELLRRPDAAFLPNGMPGRGYLQIGNENIELIQVAFTGENQLDDRPPAVVWPTRVAAQPATETDPPKLFDTVVHVARELTGDRMAQRPWPAFLPEQFSLDSPLVDTKHNITFVLSEIVADWINGETARLRLGEIWLRDVQPRGGLCATVGLLDDPAEASQEPLVLDLSRSHLVVFGDSATGKTSLLRTALTSLAAARHPDELHTYILDLGGRNFSSFTGLPHLGALISAADENFEARLYRLLEFLSQTIVHRQQLFSTAGATSFAEYNAGFPQQALPALVVLIDNFPELSVQVREENYDALVENRLLPLIRGALSAGITFLVTANMPANMPSRLYALFGERMTFRQTDTDRYVDIVGRGAVELDELPGRGYIRRNRKVLTFHAALPVGLFAADRNLLRSEAQDLRLLVAQMERAHAAHPGRGLLPFKAEVLPDRIELAEVLREASRPPWRPVALLGKRGDLSPLTIDLSRTGPHFGVIGPPRSGKTTLLYNWVLSIATHYAPNVAQFVLVDLQQKLNDYGGKRKLVELPHVLDVITEVEQIEGLVEHLKVECESLSAQTERRIFVVVDNFDDLNEEIGQRQIGRDLAGLAQRYGREGLHLVIGATPGGESSALKKRIQNSRYGVGLRSREALEAFSATIKLPGRLVRRGELPAGKGYIVEANQPTEVLIASPYGAEAAGVDPEDEARAAALDGWVDHIKAAHPGPAVCWSSPSEAAAGAQALSPKARRMFVLLQEWMQQELEHAQSGNGNGTTIIASLLKHDINQWTDEATLTELLREVHVKQQLARGYPESMVRQLAKPMDADVLLRTLEGKRKQ